MKLLIGAVIATIVLLFGAVFVFSNDKTPKRENLGNASMSIDKKVEDLGSMKADEERFATFTISNNSDASVLRIWGVSTSCDCTFATVTINGAETPEFNMPMHTIGSLKNWIGEIPTSDKAVLKVTYRPKIMPVVGPVSRQVRFSTNDPNNPEVEVSIKANVL